MNLLLALIGIFLTSLVFSMFGRGGGEFYLPIIITFLSIDYYTASGISLFLIMIQGISMITIFHGKYRLVDWKLAFILGFCVAISAFLGGFISYRIPAIYLKILFSSFLLFSAYLLYKGYRLEAKPGKIGVWKRNVHGFTYHVNLLYIVLPISIVAFVAGMAGISGGGLIIPICILFGGIPLRIAMATNTFLVLTSSFMGFAGHMVRGGFNPILAIELAIAIIAGSQIGARLHIKVRENILRKFFALILVIAASWMIIKIFI